MAQAVHQLDALLATVGMPARVRGQVWNAAHRAEVEGDAMAELAWTAGARGTVVASLTEPAGSERFEFYCEGGAVTLSDGYDVRVARHEPVQQLIDDCPDEFPEQAVTWETVEVRRSDGEWFDMLKAAQPRVRRRDRRAAAHDYRRRRGHAERRARERDLPLVV